MAAQDSPREQALREADAHPLLPSARRRVTPDVLLRTSESSRTKQSQAPLARNGFARRALNRSSVSQRALPVRDAFKGSSGVPAGDGPLVILTLPRHCHSRASPAAALSPSFLSAARSSLCSFLVELQRRFPLESAVAFVAARVSFDRQQFRISACLRLRLPRASRSQSLRRRDAVSVQLLVALDRSARFQSASTLRSARCASQRQPTAAHCRSHPTPRAALRLSCLPPLSSESPCPVAAVRPAAGSLIRVERLSRHSPFGLPHSCRHCD